MQNSNIPVNRNWIRPSGFQFQLKKLPTVVFMVQTVQLPGLNLGITGQSNPFSTIKRAGDKVNFGDLTVTFIVDEDMISYSEVFNWMAALGRSENFMQYSDLKAAGAVLGDGEYSDGSVTILTGENNPAVEIVYTGMFPTSLDLSPMESSDTSTEPVIATASFAYTYSKMRRL